MRYLLISDLHSNDEALSAVLNRVKRKKFDRIVCLGDFVGYAADPNKVLLMINTRFSEQTQRLVSDMATADRSGASEPTLLVPGVDPVSFAVFEELDRVFYRIPEGPHAGLWVRTIP